MSIMSKLAAAVLMVCLCTSAEPGSAIAQAPVSAGAAEPDLLCDYCRDFTDAALATGPVRSAYRPGVGYAEPTNAMASLQRQEQQEHDLRVVERRLSSNPDDRQ